jgi:hypothetical protein
MKRSKLSFKALEGVKPENPIGTNDPVPGDINREVNPVTHPAGESHDKNEIANRLSE